jgi:hypothetical protein
MKYQTWTTQIQVHTTMCLISSTKLSVLVLNYRLSYQAYKYMRDDSCFRIQVVISCILSLPEQHEETCYAHLTVSNTSLEKLQETRQVEL